MSDALTFHRSYKELHSSRQLYNECPDRSRFTPEWPQVHKAEPKDIPLTFPTKIKCETCKKCQVAHLQEVIQRRREIQPRCLKQHASKEPEYMDIPARKESSSSDSSYSNDIQKMMETNVLLRTTKFSSFVPYQGDKLKQSADTLKIDTEYYKNEFKPSRYPLSSSIIKKQSYSSS